MPDREQLGGGEACFHPQLHSLQYIWGPEGLVSPPNACRNTTKAPGALYGIQESLRNINHFVIFATMMKTVYTILFSLCMLLLSAGAYAQRISDSGYRTIGYIQSDGTIQDASYRITGHFKRDGTIQDSSYRIVGYLKGGTVQDKSYRIIGHIKNDGTVQDSSYRIIGHIKSDGTIQDASYRIVGHADGIPLYQAAYYFFFRN